MAGTLEVPAEGSPNSSEDPKVKAAIKRLNELLNGENLIDGAGIGSEEIEAANIKKETITDAKLASPNNAIYRGLFALSSSPEADIVAGTYLLGPGLASGANSNQGVANRPSLFYFAKADYEVAGKTQKLRLRAQVAANGTKPTIKFTFGLYPVTVAGEADIFRINTGTVVSGSTVEISEPAASTVTQKAGEDFTIPADGAYALGVVTSATLTNNSAVQFTAQLQTRWT